MCVRGAGSRTGPDDEIPGIEHVIRTSIAVIAPRHKYLERLMPYLGKRHVPVAYERREDILEAKMVLELLRMSELVTALADNRQDDADALFG